MGSLLNGKERAFFDSVNQEIVRLAGTDDPVLWKFYKSLPASLATVANSDCLYEEPVAGSKNYISYKGTPTVPLLVSFEQPTRTEEAGDNGLVTRFESRITIPRSNLEQLKIPVDDLSNHIGVGDIIQVWSKSKHSWYFEVINVERDGFENDSDVWTQYSLECVRNENFVPEKKIIK
jgi:hypothetical protein